MWYTKFNENESGDFKMLLSEIQQVVTPKVWESIRQGNSYRFNISNNFFIEGVDNHYDHYWIRLRDRRILSVPASKDYTTFCETLLKVWCENCADLKRGEIFDTSINEDEHWSCTECGKEFSHEMNFRIDGNGRKICPYCENGSIEKVRGTLNSFYD